jgi:hypothetical protein
VTNPGPILEAFRRHGVDFLLIGGMNFLVRHQPVTTFDTDLWVNDNEENLGRVTAALTELGAEWGSSNATFGPVPRDTKWLMRQMVFCLTSKAGAIDIFRSVRGLESYAVCSARAVETTRDGVSFRSLSDRDMLACQLALPEGERRLDRVAYLERILNP